MASGIRIFTLSHDTFDSTMEELGLNDRNVEETNKAFISIIGTKECLEFYLGEKETKHYFSDGHGNVLNLDFDDIVDDILYHGHIFRTMSMEQAEKAVAFIDRILDSGVEEIYVHCRAGMSRSRAFSEFIYRLCKERKLLVEYVGDRSYFTNILNQGVLNRLMHAYWKMEGIMAYEDKEKDYPEEFLKKL